MSSCRLYSATGSPAGEVTGNHDRRLSPTFLGPEDSCSGPPHRSVFWFASPVRSGGPSAPSCPVRVDKTVAIQADDSTDDSLRLLRIAHRYPFIMSVVGWIDPDGADPPKAIGELRTAPGGHTLAGIRFNARDRDDLQFSSWREDPARSVRSVVDTGLVCELLMRPENALKCSSSH